MDITKQVIEIIGEALNMPPEEISPDSHLQNNLGYDSLLMADLYMTIQERYGIKIPLDRIEQVETVQDCVDLALEYGAEKNQ